MVAVPSVNYKRERKKKYRKLTLAGGIEVNYIQWSGR